MIGKVLVLNQDFSPITICNAERAFLLIYLRKADLVIEAKDRLLRTINRSFPCPSVIKLNRYVQVPYKGVMLTRHNIFKRDRFQCVYCGTPKDLTLDHVIPKSRGGKSSWSNLVTACKRCNSRKGDLTPEEVGFDLDPKPVRPSFVLFLRDYSGSSEDWEPFLGKKEAIV